MTKTNMRGVALMSKTATTESPGYRRMRERAGGEEYESLLADTLKRQQEALDSVARERPIAGDEMRGRRDTDYPKPKKRGVKK